MNRLLIVSFAALLTLPAPAVTQVDRFPNISPAEAEFIAERIAAFTSELSKVVLADTLSPDSTMIWQDLWSAFDRLQRAIGGLGSRLTPDGIAAWGVPTLDSAAALGLRFVVESWVTTFDRVAVLGPDVMDKFSDGDEMKAKYRLAVGLLAKMGPDGVNFVTMRE